MADRIRKSLQQYATEAAQQPNGSVVCPACHCADLKVDKTDTRSTATYRWKTCRACGHKVLTATQSQERIVRDVTPNKPIEVDEDDDPRTIRLKA